MYRAIAGDVGFDDFGDIGSGNSTVPDAFGVDDDRRTVFTLVEATGFVGADSSFQSEKIKLGFEGALEFGGTDGVTASAGMAVRTLIAAYEDVFYEFSHGKKP